MGTKGKLNMTQMVCGKIFVVIEVISLISVVLTILFLWVIIGNAFSPKIDESIVVLRSYPYGYSFILIIIAVIAALFTTAPVSIHHMKKISKAVAAITVVLFIASVLVLIVEMHIYTEFTNNQIIVCKLWNTKTYEMEDVKHFIIYDEKDAIQIKLYFDDENFTEMSGPSQTYSKLYEKSYYSEYNYIADYIVRLQKAGASGQIEDVQKLQNNVANLAPQAKSGFEKIIQLMK